MNKKCTLLLAALLCLLSGVKAQYCGFDQRHAALQAANPIFAQKVQQGTAQWAQFIQSSGNQLIVNTAQGPVYEIPVVIHVIHTGGAIGSQYNPGTAQLTGMINYLNQTYAATYASYPDTNNGGTRFPIRFALAQRSPSCGATTGINRVNGSTLTGYTANGMNLNNTNGASEASVKALSIWPNNQYYNIWVVNKIDGADGITGSGTYVAGFAYFPGVPSNIDGTVMLASKAITGQITLPHEIGHAFSLYHTFEGDNGGSICPVNSNCATDGDEVCDTDPQKRSVFNCPTGNNPCTGNPNFSVVHNFMDYSNCQNRFTPGQRTRWLYGLMNYRASLISSLGTTPPSATTVTTACIPTISQTTNTFDAGIYEVVLNDMTASTEGGYNDDGAAYIDGTCQQQANVAAGSTYPINVTTGPNPERVRVWIDYNNDGVFSAAELVFSSNGNTSYQTHTGSITIPANATTCTPVRMRVTSDRTIAAVPTACGPNTYGQTEDYAVRITGSSSADTLAIALTAGTNPSCINTPLTFTATATGAYVPNSYKWFVNGVANGVTTTTFSSSTLANGAVVTARIYYTSVCGADSTTSNAIAVIRQTFVAPTVSIAVTGGTNPGCPGQPVTFTATPVNGGTTPTYIWKVNGIVQTGVTGNTFTTSALTSGNTVSATLTSSSPCASPSTANSNTITYTTGPQTATAFIYLSSGTNPACAGKPLTFTALTTNGGTTPSYQWLVNGAAVPGATLTIFTTTTLNNLDSVQLIMITSNPCVTDPTILSNVVKITVLPSDTMRVNAAITLGSNPGCKDSVLQFTATGTFGGANPAYAWFVNGAQVAAGTVYSSTTLNNGDVVLIRMIATGPGCRVSDTAYSTPITLSISATPGAPTISFIGTMLVSDSANVQWYGPNGLIPGATSQSFHPTMAGNYYAVTLNNGCTSPKSNILLLSLLNVSQYNLSGVHIFPNPTRGQLVIDWDANPSVTRIAVYTPSGQIVLRDIAQNASRKTLDLSGLANGVYFVVLQDESGKAGTVRIVVAK